MARVFSFTKNKKKVVLEAGKVAFGMAANFGTGLVVRNIVKHVAKENDNFLTSACLFSSVVVISDLLSDQITKRSEKSFKEFFYPFFELD